MKASVAMGTLAFVVLGLSTSAYAQNVEQVRRELTLKGYDQIEFTRTKPPFRVNACRGSKRLRLHVDYYGKVAKRTLIGFCHGDGLAGPAVASPAVVAREQAAENENSINSAARPKDKPKITNDVDCKRYIPSVGMTLTVACE